MYLFQLFRALYFRIARKLGFTDKIETIDDQSLDRFTVFDEYPDCDVCGNTEVEELFYTKDNSRLVRCKECKTVFTSPRIKESDWIAWLRQDTERSRLFTENRLKHGVALTSNIKYIFPFWKRSLEKQYSKIFINLEKYLGKKNLRLHDVGCGVGFLLQTGVKRGYSVTGNELNRYACVAMKERMGLEVYNEMLPDVPIQNGQLDAIIMRDYIEHTYHPYRDTKKAYDLLRPGGILYIETFKTDCRAYDELKNNWNMLFWNHTHHFDSTTLCNMVKKAGFEILSAEGDYASTLIYIYAQKQ